MGKLVLAGNTLYGTTYNRGIWGNGTLFALRTDGTGFTNLHSFAGRPNDGSLPDAGMVASGATLYGTTSDEKLSGVTITVSNLPVIVNGQNTVTVPIFATHAFYSLGQ
jgi:uncharacterized repeat protein (TIGR03803 family)